MPGKSVHVLLVDDNAALLGICTEFLENAGHRVTPCSTGLGALLRIGCDPPDVVVLDIKLGDISGFEIFRALRNEASTKDLPVLFISGVYLDENMVREQSGDPNVRLLLKPILGEDLIREVEIAARLDLAA